MMWMVSARSHNRDDATILIRFCRAVDLSKVDFFPFAKISCPLMVLVLKSIDSFLMACAPNRLSARLFAPFSNSTSNRHIR